MEFYLESEMRELLSAFDSAYIIAWETAQDIEEFVKASYDGDTEQFLSDVAHSCDYFSLAPILRQFFDENSKK